MSVSVIIPAFNEETRLPNTLVATVAYFQARGESFEVLVVDDGSKDGTANVVKAFAEAHPDLDVQCLSYGANRGKGFAVRFGMLRASGDLRVFCDADLATPPEEYEVVLAGMQAADAQIGIGSRPLRESHLTVRQPWLRERLGRGFNKVVRLLAVPGIADTQCGFKIWTAQAALDVFSRCRLDGWAFDSEALFITHRLGYRIAEVAIRWADQPGSKVNVARDFVPVLRDLSSIRWMHRRLKSQTAASSAPRPHA